MRAKSLALLVLALGCGLVASIGITQVMSNKDAEPVVQTGDSQSVFVAKEDVPFGDPLTSQSLRLEEWPKDKIPSGALCRIEDVEGRRARTKLYAGEPVLENKLFGKGASEQGYSTVIPKGYRVVAVKVDRVSGSSLILPGDRVDVLVYLDRNPAKGIVETTTRTILQDVKVFAVNDVVETENRGEKSANSQTISLLVTPEHAELVALAEMLGRMRLIMRSPQDDEVVNVQGSTPSQLFHGTEAEDRQQEALREEPNLSASQGKEPGFLAFLDQMRAKAAPKGEGLNSPQSANPNTHQMRMMLGSEVKDVVLESEGNQSASSPWLELWKLGGWDSPPSFHPTGEMPELNEPAAEEEQEPAEEEKEEKGEGD